MKRIKVPRFIKRQGFETSDASSIRMQKIKSKDTKPELLLRKSLWRKGFRYRLQNSQITGKPDLVFSTARVVVFIDGDFWHGFNWEARKSKMSINKKYWIPKIERNMQRDQEITLQLTLAGWKVIRLWEHEIYDSIQSCIDIISSRLQRDSH